MDFVENDSRGGYFPPANPQTPTAAFCRGALWASALYRNACNKRNNCRGAFRAPVNKRHCYHARNNFAGKQRRNRTKGRPLQQVAYSIAIQIKDLVRCLSCRASPLRKQPTGLFSDSPLAERLRFVSPLSKNCERRPETLSLDSASLCKGLSETFGFAP